MMRFPGRKIIGRAMRPIVRNFFPGAVVLGYHRIARPSWDPFRLSVAPEHFLSQLEVLKSLREVISLTELVARHAAGERLDPYAAVTFDDGYADFAETVVPLASRAAVPVTGFVASGFTGRSFWWEEVPAILGPDSDGPPELEIRMNGEERWRFTDLERLEGRHAAAARIGDRLVGRPAKEVEAVLEQLRDWAGRRPSPSGRPMTREELARVARIPGVEIGAHTVSHGNLAAMARETRREEISNCKTELEAICGTSVKVFSYPHGLLSGDTADLVKSLGFSCACMSRDGVFSGRGDPFRIPRLWVSDVAGPEFGRWLGDWVAERR